VQPQKPNVLVVDDDAAIRGLLHETLEDAGHGVAEAPDGQAALARLDAGPVDLLLLDMMLPDLNGLEICRQVRATGRALYLPIIMITALAGDEERHTGFAAGADDYVTKPFHIPDVLDRVSVWLRMRERLRVAWERRLEDAEAALLLAQTPLQVLINVTRAWEVGASVSEVAEIRMELQQTAQALSAQIERLSQLLRSEEVQPGRGHREGTSRSAGNTRGGD
jgi:DNA-binding response OmpR family regulator